MISKEVKAILMVVIGVILFVTGATWLYKTDLSHEISEPLFLEAYREFSKTEQCQPLAREHIADKKVTFNEYKAMQECFNRAYKIEPFIEELEERL